MLDISQVLYGNIATENSVRVADVVNLLLQARQFYFENHNTENHDIAQAFLKDITKVLMQMYDFDYALRITQSQ